ncbi:MAG TPA: secondary thiamine-phosphate synthase enzyme YjbQ [Planktothrix sp.]|jgi:secondary thiamine-phosphate synthase enzyme
MPKTETVATSRKKQVVDITDKVERILQGKKAEAGVCHVFCLHTTSAITTADLDPGTDLDMLDAFEEMIPKLAYRHPHNPAHVGDHIMSTIIGPGVLVPVEDGKLVLGTWQRVVLVELDGPRHRKIAVTFLPED